MTIEEAMAILGEAPTLIHRGKKFDEACKLAVQVMAEKLQKDGSNV